MKPHTVIVILAIFSPLLFAHRSIARQGPVVLVIGTRPEAIKMIPVYKALQSEGIAAVICSTGQHTDLLEDIFTLFGISPNCSLNIMKPGQDLFYVTTSVLTKIKEYPIEVQPSLVLVQGDTTSAMAAALAAFYLKIPVGHIEAGLRTHNIYAPFPEEMNRQFISLIATYHFAPTQLSQENLLHENHDPESVFCVGNTVVDALGLVCEGVKNGTVTVNQHLQTIVTSCKNSGKKIMLLTAHRRESFDGGLKNIFEAVKTALEIHPNLFVIYPMHPNPMIKEAFDSSDLAQMPNIVVTKPLIYHDLVYLLDATDLVATDSGGIQEEAVSLGKPTLVLRNETDRPEGVMQGIAKIVGTETPSIINHITNALMETRSHLNRAIYGDGTASVQIAHLIKKKLSQSDTKKELS
jgi:UDP-N-acetylglucosamine 2-epimerase (non-hydrolysing)